MDLKVLAGCSSCSRAAPALLTTVVQVVAVAHRACSSSVRHSSDVLTCYNNYACSERFPTTLDIRPESLVSGQTDSKQCHDLDSANSFLDFLLSTSFHNTVASYF